MVQVTLTAKVALPVVILEHPEFTGVGILPMLLDKLASCECGSTGRGSTGPHSSPSCTRCPGVSWNFPASWIWSSTQAGPAASTGSSLGSFH